MNRWDNGNHSWWKHDSVVLILLQDGVRRSQKTHRSEGSGGDKSVLEDAWIAKAEKERDELRERLGSYSEQHKAENREVVHHTIKKRPRFRRGRCLRQNRRKRCGKSCVTLLLIEACQPRESQLKNSENFVSQKQNTEDFERHFRDVSNLKFEKHTRGMKKAINRILWCDVDDAEVCYGFNTDAVNAVLCIIKPNKAVAPDKIHPRFMHHMGPVCTSMLTSTFDKMWEEAEVPQNWRASDMRPIPKRDKESNRPMSLT